MRVDPGSSPGIRTALQKISKIYPRSLRVTDNARIFCHKGIRAVRTWVGDANAWKAMRVAGPWERGPCAQGRSTQVTGACCKGSDGSGLVTPWKSWPRIQPCRSKVRDAEDRLAVIKVGVMPDSSPSQFIAEDICVRSAQGPLSCDTISPRDLRMSRPWALPLP